jgi:hypothetical protein
MTDTLLQSIIPTKATIMGHNRLTKTRAKNVRHRVRNDELKQPVKVSGQINFSNDLTLEEITENLRGCDELLLRGCKNLHTLPENLKVDLLDVSDCMALRKLPSGLHAKHLIAANSGLRGMASSVTVHEHLNVNGCAELLRLPHKLKVWYLYMLDCIALVELPDKLSVSHLNMAGCVSFTTWGADGRIMDIPGERSIQYQSIGRNSPRTVILRNCRRLTHLPEWMNQLHFLDIRNCRNLTELPATLGLVAHLEIGNSGLVQRPDNAEYKHLYWNGVLVNDKIAWHPHELTADDAFNEANLEVRRVIIERIGYERFFAEADAELMDIDEDAGGERQLLRVNLPNIDRWNRDEAIICLAVNCPSTQHKYILRVPPVMENCHQAAAWIAGFDNPDLYRPVKET